jgi:hypothetical protein
MVAGYQLLVTGWILDAGYWMLDAGNRLLVTSDQTVQNRCHPELAEGSSSESGLESQCCQLFSGRDRVTGHNLQLKKLTHPLLFQMEFIREQIKETIAIPTSH